MTTSTLYTTFLCLTFYFITFSSVIKKMPVWLVFIHQEVLLSVSNVAIMRETSYQIEITYQNVSLSAH
jgi:hypothetical protein